MEVYQPEEQQTTKPVDKNAATVNMLMERAYKGKQSEFTLIKSLDEAKVVDDYKKQSTEVAKSFIKAKNDLLKEYIKRSKDGQDPVELLISYKSIDKVIDYYKAEAAVADSILNEFAAYMHNGHTLSVLSGRQRAEEDMWDHRHDKPTD